MVNLFVSHTCGDDKSFVRRRCNEFTAGRVDIWFE